MNLPPVQPHQARSLTHQSGMTLIELSVVLALSIFLVGMVFLGARAWKRGADRAGCVSNIYQVQQAMRGFASVHDYYPGQDVGHRVDLFSELVGPDKYLRESPVCPRDGVYTHNGDVVPPTGQLYLSCSLALSDSHLPEFYGNW